METLNLSIAGMSCGHCVAAVRRALEAVPGVEVEEVRIGGAALRVAPAAGPGATEAALAAVRDAGYDAAVGTGPAPQRLTPLASRRAGGPAA